MSKKQAKKLVDSRYIKILSAKKDELKDSIVFICLDEEKFGRLDKSGLRSIAKQIEVIEPEAVYIPLVKKMNVQILDRAQFNNKDVIVTVSHQTSPSSQVQKQIEDQIYQAIPNAKSVNVIHEDIEFKIQ